MFVMMSPNRSHTFPEDEMNRDQLQGMWKQYKGAVKEQWGKLTDDDLDVIGGKYDQLVGRVQERYGIAREEAQRQVDEYVKTLDAETEMPERRKAS
jgi:uncharacterized protein YjbJ (UPF0337 family)